MGRLGVSYEDVAKAIAKLKKKKISITVDNIRIELGAGSKSTICRYLREWKHQEGNNDDYYTLRRDMIQFLRAMRVRLGISPTDIVNL